jgi:hypothetical protein
MHLTEILFKILERIGQRMEFEAYQAEQKRKAEEEADAERGRRNRCSVADVC